MAEVPNVQGLILLCLCILHKPSTLRRMICAENGHMKNIYGFLQYSGGIQRKVAAIDTKIWEMRALKSLT